MLVVFQSQRMVGTQSWKIRWKVFEQPVRILVSLEMNRRIRDSWSHHYRGTDPELRVETAKSTTYKYIYVACTGAAHTAAGAAADIELDGHWYSLAAVFCRRQN